MLNYTSRPHDVLVMAHELGHGVHAALARPQGIYHFSTPLTLAETASIFGENIVLERLLERAPGPAERLDLLAGALDGAVAAVFRQIAMNRFEDAIHTARREAGELSVERFGELWLATQGDLLGDVGRARRRLRAVVVLHLALRGRAWLRVRVRVRSPARAVGVPALRGARARASCPPTWTC